MRGRRNIIKAGIAALAGASLGDAWSADKKKDKDEPPPRQRPLITKGIPSSGERLAMVGVGTNNYSPATPYERAARREVLAGLTAAGASVIDTAPSYRQSEDVIGDLLAEIGNRKQAFIATKVTAPDGNLQTGIAMIEDSFRKLKTDVIDLLQIHNLNGVDVLFPHLEQLKAKGRVRYIGMTTSNESQHDQMVDLIKSAPLDFVQVDYSLGNRESADDVLPLALEKQIGVLVNMPFGGRSNNNLFSRVAGRDLPEWANDIGALSWGQVFIKYVVSHPAVTVGIPGMTKASHLQDNLEAIRTKLPNAAQRARMEKWWDQNFPG